MIGKEMYPTVLSNQSFQLTYPQIEGLSARSAIIKTWGQSEPLLRNLRQQKKFICGVNERRRPMFLQFSPIACMHGVNGDKNSSINFLSGHHPDKSEKKNEHDLPSSVTERPQKAQQQLNILDAYFSKLHSHANDLQEAPFVPNEIPRTVSSAPSPQQNQNELASQKLHLEGDTKESGKNAKLTSELNALDGYFSKLHPRLQESNKSDVRETTGKKEKSTKTEEALIGEELSKIVDIVNVIVEHNKESKSAKDADDNQDMVNGLISTTNESYNPYLINGLAAINIAVYIFELASPVKTSEVEILSLPVLYGAKINELILNGEWWRLITPMFLHQGLLHVAFSTWALLTFGPLVDKIYGSPAFCMIFFLGGLCGNIMSFFHGPNATVGGTGPILAIMGSWVAYVIQNRQALGEETTAIMMQKVTLASLLSVALSLLIPIDDWTHLGAVCVGLTFGTLVCPAVPANVPSKGLLYGPESANEPREEATLFSQKPAPHRLFGVFVLFVAILTALFYVLAPVVTEIHSSSMGDSF